MNDHHDFKYTDDDFSPKYKHLRPKTAEAEGSKDNSLDNKNETSS